MEGAASARRGEGSRVSGLSEGEDEGRERKLGREGSCVKGRGGDRAGRHSRGSQEKVSPLSPAQIGKRPYEPDRTKQGEQHEVCCFAHSHAVAGRHTKPGREGRVCD